MVERFLSDEQSIAVRATFAGLWGLEHDNIDTEQIVANARDHPEIYVLKPQLEGGGGNYYGANISKKLIELDAKQRAAYILMQRVRPLVTQVGHSITTVHEHSTVELSDSSIYTTSTGKYRQ